ncbi:Protein of uncharacterised function (DUF2618) [Escherichia coli]|uniref:Leader peptide SpeFL n=1 Tax=Escherichia coli TaxID=562 RepID=A0A376TIY3_ECOLX|nr:Protein of uncharacterised function (DUF2618) [Escherichia coli]
MENNNRLMPHIRRTTHIMKFAHRNSFDFHFFNAASLLTKGHPNVQVSLTLSITG